MGLGIFLFIALGLPAVLGVWMVRLWHGELEEGDEFANPTGIAIGVSLVIAASMYTFLAPDAERVAGPWIKYFWLYSTGTFLIGLFIGWADVRNGSK